MKNIYSFYMLYTSLFAILILRKKELLCKKKARSKKGSLWWKKEVYSIKKFRFLYAGDPHLQKFTWRCTTFNSCEKRKYRERERNEATAKREVYDEKYISFLCPRLPFFAIFYLRKSEVWSIKCEVYRIKKY